LGSGTADFVDVPGAPEETPVLAGVRADGACAFYERDSGLCAIHRQAGSAMLPVACRQFPRVSLLDGRGLFVNVSHYCPTAAALLFRDERPLQIVQSPAAFSANFDYDPLDARDAIPPLLRPGVMLDLETFGNWERQAIAALARDDWSVEEALGHVAAFTERLRAWNPGGTSLREYFDETVAASEPPFDEVGRATRELSAAGVSLVNAVLDCVPAPLRPVIPLDRASAASVSWVQPEWSAFARPVRRYLASKVFGSWLAYEGHGLRTIVVGAAAALALLELHAAIECDRQAAPLTRDILRDAIRRTDEVLVHLASRETLARRLGACEKVATLRWSDVR
jgi:hypothetical protein